jgi:hypothetical protein
MVSIASKERDGDDGDLEGWESAWAWVGGRKSVCLAARRSPRSFSEVPRAADAPGSPPWPRGRHGDAGDSIGLETLGAHWCEPRNHADPKTLSGQLSDRRCRCSYISKKKGGYVSVSKLSLFFVDKKILFFVKG